MTWAGTTGGTMATGGKGGRAARRSTLWPPARDVQHPGTERMPLTAQDVP